MTPEQVEKVRAELREIARFCDLAAIVNDEHEFPRKIERMAEAALDALKEDESWRAARAAAGGWGVWHGDLGSLPALALGMDEATARRIARLPALERAAREVLKTFGGGPRADVGGAIYALRTALADSPDAARERRSTGE